MKRNLLIAISCFILGGAQSIFAQDAQVPADSLDSFFKNLPEIMVKGERPIAKMEKGKLTYQMPLLLEKIPADNAYDAITKIPGVFVQSDRINFTNRPVTLIIDGKISAMDYSAIVERLKAMSAEQIEKAEVMFSAPANYHVRGAVINIVTKKHVGSKHLSGQLAATYRQSKYSTENAKANIMMTNNKLSVDATYSFTNSKSYSEAEHNAKHPLNGTTVDYCDFTSNLKNGKFHNYHIGSDYNFSKKHVLSLAYNGRYEDYTSDNTTSGTSISTQHTLDEEKLNNVEVNYVTPFSLSLSASYTNYQSPSTQLLNGTLQQEDKNYQSRSNQKINKYMFTADQSHSLKGNWSIMYGAKAQFSNNNSFQTTVTPSGETIPEATSSVDINERIINFYGGFSKQFSKAINLSANATIENYHRPNCNDWRLYPEFNLSYVVNAANIFNLSFDSDTSYPSYWSTMSSIYYSSTYSEIWGNPNLKPSSEYDITLTWQFKREYAFSVYANLRPDFITQLPYQTSDRMAVIMKVINLDHRNSFGAKASAQFSIGSWLNGSAFAIASYTNDKCDDFFDIPFDRSKFTTIAGGYAAATLSKKHNITFIANPFLQTSAIQGVYDIDPIFKLNASLRWNSSNKHWSIVVDGNNLTNHHFSMKSVYRNQNFAMKVNQDWINASITCTYKFGNYEKKSIKEVDTSRMGH